MTCIAIIGVPRTTYSLVESIVHARLRGIDVVLVDIQSVLKKTAGWLPLKRKLPVPALDLHSVVEALTPIQPHFVVSFTEFNMVLAAEVRERLCLSGLSPRVEERVRHKDKTRARLAETGLTHIQFETCTLAQLNSTVRHFEPPFVIKPINLTGSVGVCAIRNHKDISMFPQYFVDFDKERSRDRSFLIEDFIDGTEYSVEGISLNGCFHMLALTKKYTNGFPNFAEIGHILPGRTLSKETYYSEFIQRVVTSLEIGTAPIHAEVIESSHALELVEIHTRFAGDLIPLLMERAFEYKVFGMYYDALMFGQVPKTNAPALISGIRFLDRNTVKQLREIPLQASNISYDITVNQAANTESEPSLDNIRIQNHRCGHIVFQVTNHDDAEHVMLSFSS